MVVTSVIDFHFMIIPDKISIPGIFMTPLVILLHPELSWKSGLLGILLGGGFIFALAWFYHFLRKKEGIGMGDAKLLALMGGWLGYEALFPILFYSSLSGSLIGIILLSAQKKLSMKAAIPFGPFLALGALIQLLSPVSFWSFFL
jgi:leader peptidase (prepilin peptidase)/N-methyltransferase